MAREINGVTVHSDGRGRKYRPAVNVKTYDFGGPGIVKAIMARFACPESVAENALQAAYENHVAGFWATAADDGEASAHFGRPVKVYSEGRMGGWLVVDGLPDIEDWTRAEHRKWASYERQIQRAVKSSCAEAAILETIDTQEWYITPCDASAPARCVAC